MFILQHLPIVCLVLSGLICVISSSCSSKLENSLFGDLIGMMLKLKGTEHRGQGIELRQKHVPAFTAYRNSVQSLSSNAIVKFDKLWTNTMNAYDVTTGVFTAPMPGLYHFSAVVMSEEEHSLFDDLIGMMLKLKGTGNGGQGNISTKKDTPAFTAYRNSVQTLSSNAIVKFDKLWTNNLNAYDLTTGVFTAPMPGLYHFSAVVMSEDGKTLFLHLWDNDIKTAGSYTQGDGYKTGTFDVVLNLKKGDRIYIRCKGGHDSQTIYNNVDNYSTFSGYIIAK